MGWLIVGGSEEAELALLAQCWGFMELRFMGVGACRVGVLWS